MAVEFRLLADLPHLVPTLAGWYDAEWPHLFHPGSSAMDEAKSCAANRDRPDCTIMMFHDSELTGAASLLVEDVLPFPEFSPWLGSVIVQPAHRGKGLGTLLVREAMRHAEAIGLRTLHLWTPAHRHFYERLGWEFVRDFVRNGNPAAILRLDPQTPPA